MLGGRIEHPASGHNVGMQVMSVTGPVQPCDLGVVLPYEHVFADLVREYRGAGLLNDEYLACRELDAFAAGGGTILVDLTLDEIGRDPPAVRRDIDLSAVRCPVLLWYGSDDRFSQPAHRLWLSENLANARLIVRDGEGASQDL